ncbi:hypothetical protein CkaCkLH20_06583 [Colletotrichum karsti]|uniref:Uncharacterized protein n=1 Tax=Colletotrichum karsti TaxID=1095194 RepID=A0A9P6LL32_9PEZI|nr:uncharacterized protein CkaCkLH20_06583 [Colletotrichum karsti]KAF9876137.1 hypothetical protein CkaCkLH20_06583 [Colletotrichum karsti]
MATLDTHTNGHFMPKDFHAHSTGGIFDVELSTSPDTSNHVLEMGRTRRMPRSSDVLSRDGSPNGSTRSYGNVRSHSHSHGHSSRMMSSRSRRGSWAQSYQRHHSSEVSKELTAQAEGEFFALTELMANMSRRSGSLKEVWNKIISERESCYSEMDRMQERIEEFAEIIDRKEREHDHHHHDHEERKQEVLKIRLQLKSAANDKAEFQTKLAERDAECRALIHDIAQVKDNLSHVRREHEETKKTSETHRHTLLTTETARAELEDKYGKLRIKCDGIDLKLTELQSRYDDVTIKFDTQHKELVHAKQVNSVLKKEKHEWLHREGEMDEMLRKHDHRHDEIKRKCKEFEERLEKKQLEVKELQETIPRIEQRVLKVKHEKTELEQHIEKLKRDISKEHNRWEEAEDRCGKWKLKWEHSEREIAAAREDITRIEISHGEMRDTISKKTEELRLLHLEKKRLEEEGGRHSGRADDTHRQLTLIQETLSHAQSELTKSQEEVHVKNERIERLELDYTTAKTRAKDYEIEGQSHRSLVSTLKLEIDNLTNENGSLKQKCHTLECKYDEVCESVTEYEDGNSGYDFEINSMRTMLREAREQKEKAITARNSADRERDEYIAKYEEKCREMERLEERMTQHMHEQQGRRQSSSSKTVLRHASRQGSHSHGSHHHHHHHHSGASEFGTTETC